MNNFDIIYCLLLCVNVFSWSPETHEDIVKKIFSKNDELKTLL